LRIMNKQLEIEKLVLKKEILNLILNFINYQMKHFAKEDFLLLI